MVGSKRSFFGLTHASPTKNMSKLTPFMCNHNHNVK